MNIAPNSNKQSIGQTLSGLLSSLEPNLLQTLLGSPLQRSLDLLSDERIQNLYILTDGDRPSRIQAANRLAQLMVPPPLDRVTNATAEARAKELGMPVERYFREAIYPDAILRASDNIARPQMAPRLGRRWVINEETGTRGITTAREVYDDECIHWLYQEAKKACKAIVTERPYANEDALERVVEDADGSFAEKALITESLQERSAIESANRQLGTLLEQVSAKERALLTEAVRRDGDLTAVLLEHGYRQDAARKKCQRWRKCMK